MSNKFSNKTQVNLRPKVCKSPPPPPHPEPPPPAVPLCLTINGTLTLGVNGPFTVTGGVGKVYRFVVASNGTYHITANYISGLNFLLGSVKIDNVGCCGSGVADTTTFSTTTTGNWVNTILPFIWIICVRNVFSSITFTLVVTKT